ncbi:hypothetical protein SD71_10285 [Cohnella kolymensis]|uniref:HrgC protein n=1 Tax=Cohnella kolymensis TaxID=1590652 RepID=A0ABR5A410_9BACL|nr:hypothetical protein [Cohnella kolymensis]KIL35792.1 hypothetical protein SD71_10285 [Cohnella kolymensis]
MYINLRNQVGMIKQRKVGFSWTTFFFAFFPALFRGDWKWAIIQFICSSLTFGVSNLVFCFIYNKLHINDLLEKGYTPSDESSRVVLVTKGFIAETRGAAVS